MCHGGATVGRIRTLIAKDKFLFADSVTCWPLASSCCLNLCFYGILRLGPVIDARIMGGPGCPRQTQVECLRMWRYSSSPTLSPRPELSESRIISLSSLSDSFSPRSCRRERSVLEHRGKQVRASRAGARRGVVVGIQGGSSDSKLGLSRRDRKGWESRWQDGARQGIAR